MFDNINFHLSSIDVPYTSFLEETTNYLTRTSEYQNEYSSGVIGYLDTLKVTINENSLKIKDSSFCKWYFGNNLVSMKRKDVERAIQKLSDELHLPMNKAKITRLDISKNFIMKYDKQEYLNHLGNSQYMYRLEQPEGLYYNNSSNPILNTKQLVFYDKLKEQKNHNCNIPEFLKGLNFLRIELRLKKRLSKELNIPEIKAYMLYEAEFYIKAIDLWFNEYKRINKINKIQFDYTMVKTKKELSTQAILFYAISQGGEIQALKEIQMALKRNELTKKQAFDLRNTIKKAFENKLLTCKSEAIQELDNKMNNAVKFYR